MKTDYRVALIRKTVVAVAGFSVLLIGVAMIVLPGPAIVMIPLGLAILASEFVWAQALLRKARNMITRSEAKKAAKNA
jgi:uncharacterized protein (TIGR02611 family)